MLKENNEKPKNSKKLTEKQKKKILWKYHATWERRKFLELFEITSEQLDEMYDEVLHDHKMCVGM